MPRDKRFDAPRPSSPRGEPRAKRARTIDVDDSEQKAFDFDSEFESGRVYIKSNIGAAYSDDADFADGTSVGSVDRAFENCHIGASNQGQKQDWESEDLW